jgi:xyloglucan-specific exo-beta-1,4-glucanase
MNKNRTWALALVLLALGCPAIAADVPSQPYQWQHVKIVGTGYVPGIIFSEAEKDLIYLRTDMGGAYRWLPDQKKWKPLTDWVTFEEWNLLGIESIAADPSDPNRVYVAAGTYTNDWTTMNGEILRSTDRGDHFVRTKLPFKMGGNMPGRSVGERLVVDPNDNRVLLFGARSGKGLWRSEDFGATWSHVDALTAVGDYVQDPQYSWTADNLGLTWVAFDPRSSAKGEPCRVIYVGVATTTGPTLWRTKDAGKSWEAVPGQPADGYMVIHGTLAKNGVLYLTTNNKAGPYDGDKGSVLKFDTATDTWTNITPPTPNGDKQYYGFGGLGVDAQKPDTLVIATLNSWWPDCMFWRSTNAGKTWTQVWTWNGYPGRLMKYNLDYSASPWIDWGTKGTMPEVSPKLGWMTSDLRIDPFNSNRMMYGTGATVYGTENLTNWDKNRKFDIAVMAEGIEESSVGALVSLPAGPPLISGIGDVNGFVHTDLNKSPKTMMLNPSFATLAIDFAEARPSVIVRIGKTNKAKTNESRLGVSTDAGKSWNPGTDAPGVAADKEAGGGTIALAADARALVWAPEGVVPAVSADLGKSWKPSQGLPADARVVADRVNAKVFYGWKDGVVYASTDAGATFQETGRLAAALGNVKFKAMAGHEGELWFSATGKAKDGESGDGTLPGSGMWRTSDGGATFVKVAGVDRADSIGFGKAKDGQPFQAVFSYAIVNGLRGVFRSDDAGATWVRVNDDDHNYGAANADITGDPRVYGRVYLATNGRGIPYGDIKK